MDGSLPPTSSPDPSEAPGPPDQPTDADIGPAERPRLEDRRSFGRRLAVGVGVAWVAPTVISVRAAEAATCPPIPSSPPDLVVGPNVSFVTPNSGQSVADFFDTSVVANPPPPPPPAPTTTSFVWAEAGPITLTTGLAVSRSAAAGTFNAPGGSFTIPASVAAPITLYSYMVHVRRPAGAGNSAFFEGFLTIPASLVLAGFSYSTATLRASGGAAGAPDFRRPGLTYLYPGADGEACEGQSPVTDPKQDKVTIVANADGTATVRWHLFTGQDATGVNFSDELRLFVSAAPCA